MSDEIQITAARITKHGDELKSQVVPAIEKARTTLNGINLEGGDFSITGTACGVAYPGALQFAFETLKTHEEQVTGLAANVEAAAKGWRRGEDYSTVKQV